MWSNPDPAAQSAESLAHTYVYPPAQDVSPGLRPSSPPGNDSTLELLLSPEAPSPALVSEEQIQAREGRARKEGWEKGRKDGEAQAREEYEKRLSAERGTLALAVREFASERETYFSRVEGEVVELALAIARKILHREAQVDSLLLAGVVRIGLEKTAVGTQVRLRVPPDQTQAWQEFFSQQPDLPSVPELMGDAALGPGQCRLETELGSTDLTLEVQLKEIEQGFFDLLAQRPAQHT